jgi:hypothetical protein
VISHDPDMRNPAGHGGAREVRSWREHSRDCSAPNQAENDPSLITCASMRADELRGCLVREILRASAIGMQAQAALLDSDDALAIENLRRHWRVIRASIAPLAAEFRAISGGGTS